MSFRHFYYETWQTAIVSLSRELLKITRMSTYSLTGARGRTGNICTACGQQQGFLWRLLCKSPDISSMSLSCSPQWPFQGSLSPPASVLACKGREGKGLFQVWMVPIWCMKNKAHGNFSQLWECVYGYWKSLGQNQVSFNQENSRWKNSNKGKNPIVFTMKIFKVTHNHNQFYSFLKEIYIWESGIRWSWKDRSHYGEDSLPLLLNENLLNAKHLHTLVHLLFTTNKRSWYNCAHFAKCKPNLRD